MSTSNIVRTLLLASSVAAALVPGFARARATTQDATTQETSAQEATTQETAPETAENQLGAVVVTATRRQESILNVPVSVSAQTRESLDKQGVRNMSDLASLTPGLQFAPTGYPGGDQISIRGISSFIGAATTAIYIDDTPFQVRQLGAANAAASTFPPIFDLDRIEVLRGPQGTLFGASAEGGAVRFITPQPSLSSYSVYSRGELGFTDGGDPTTEIGAAGGGPIVTGRLGFRLSAYDRRDGGWIDRVNPFTENVVEKNANGDETQVFDGALKFAATDDLTVTGKVYHARIVGYGVNTEWRDLSDPEEGRFYSGDAIKEPQNDRYTLYSMTVDYRFGSAELISDTSYFDRADLFTDDYTEGIPELLGLPYILGPETGAIVTALFTQGQQTFTQDIRLQSQGDGRLKWVVGAFFQNARQQISEFLPSPNANALTLAGFGETVPQVFGGVPLLEPGDSLYMGVDGSRDKDQAVYGQVDYQPIDRLTFTAGVRFAKDEFGATNGQYGPFGAGAGQVVMGESDKPVTPKVAISYKPSENTMIYTSVAKGFRPGGGNTPVPMSVCTSDLAAVGLKGPPASYAPDYVWSYEVGAKGALADHRVTFESSAYYINWKDIQSVIGLPCGFTVTVNAAQAVSKGADLQVNLLPLTGLSLTAAVGYTDARYSKPLFGGVMSSGQRALVIAEGDRLVGYPLTVSFHAEYHRLLSSRSELMGYVHGDYNYASGSTPGHPGTVSFDPTNNYIFSTHMANLRVGLRTEAVDASIFANNVLNSQSILSAGHALGQGLYEDVLPRPRTIGLTVTYRYQ